jgi:hypothetical protein
LSLVPEQAKHGRHDLSATSSRRSSTKRWRGARRDARTRAQPQAGRDRSVPHGRRAAPRDRGRRAPARPQSAASAHASARGGGESLPVPQRLGAQNGVRNWTLGLPASPARSPPGSSRWALPQMIGMGGGRAGARPDAGFIGPQRSRYSAAAAHMMTAARSTASSMSHDVAGRTCRWSTSTATRAEIAEAIGWVADARVSRRLRRSDHGARYRVVKGLGDDRAEGRWRRTDRARHRPAREPRRQARLYRRCRCDRGAVREAVEQAERIAGTNIENVWVSFSAGGLVSDVAEVEFELGGHRVEQQDIDACSRQGRRIDRSPPAAWCCTRSRRSTRSTA